MNQNSQASRIVQKVWQYAHILKDDGLAFMDYTEQITFLMFLKMAWDQSVQSGESLIPLRYSWGTLLRIDDNKKRLIRYQQALRKLSNEPGLIGLIFAKPQSKISDPAKLHLLMQMMDGEDWSSLDIDVKGEVYEGLLARNADDVRGGAGQYFTPRPVVQAVVEVMRPEAAMTVADPACGTGGFLLSCFDYMNARANTPKEQAFIRTRAIHGNDIVVNVARLCAMNLFLRGVGLDPNFPPVTISDSLERPSKKVDMVLTNPPFGKKSSFTIVGQDGKRLSEKFSYERPDFWATTSNKQLNFLQHIHSMLKPGGRAAVVVPDNVLFEGGAGERIRRALLASCHLHTILRLPVGIWYSPGVQANVLFFDKPKLKSIVPVKDTWIYDLRAGSNFSLRQNPIRDADLKDFIDAYRADDRDSRHQSSRFRRFSYDEIVASDRANLDMQWLRSSSVEPSEETAHSVLAQIVSDLNEAVRQFSLVERELL
jgi:type I restriction enzyme M protein